MVLCPFDRINSNIDKGGPIVHIDGVEIINALTKTFSMRPD